MFCILPAIKLSKNDLGEFLSLLYSASAKWYNLGLALGLNSDELDAIVQQYSAPGDCLREALKSWLSTNPQMGDLIKALKDSTVGHGSLIKQLLGWASRLPSRPELQCHDNFPSVQPTFEHAGEEQEKQPDVFATHCQVGVLCR